MSAVRYELKGQVGIIWLDSPPVNALSRKVRKGIVQSLDEASDDETKVIVLIGRGRMFTAGADITEMGKPRLSPKLPEVLARIEQFGKPILAAIHGTTMGGGVEMSLCCHYRCALDSAKLGLPEVKLGILPGAGGTQRVPRLSGIDAALEMMTSGRPLPAGKAKEIGLLDRVIDGDLFEGALAFAIELANQHAPLRRVREIPVEPASADLFDQWRNRLAKRAHGQIAPGLIVDCVEAATRLPMDEGLAFEREKFVECMYSPQSKAMRHMFFAQRQAAKIKGLPSEAPMRKIQKAGIIGAGTMGGGIAMNFANAGIPVTILDTDNEALDRGFGIIRKNYGVTVSKGKLSEEQARSCLGRISRTTEYSDLEESDIIIEAVFEDIGLKKRVFSKLDETCNPGAILATNTSYQDVDEIAQATGRPGSVLGLHFFSPANVMKLLEVVRGEATSDDVLATAMGLARTIGKIPVLSGVCYGFIGNRMLRSYGREAQLCLIEGATPSQIDGAMQKFGMAMGPLAVYDLAGLDVGHRARQALADEHKGDPRAFYVVDTLVEQGRFGQKTGAGYYRYDPNSRARLDDPEVMDIVVEQAAKHGIERRTIEDDEIVARMVYALANEGAKILAEGIAQRPGDIDVAWVFGYGFPVARGGPMHYADQVGLETVYQAVCRFRELHGECNWSPAPLLQQLATEGGTFAEWEA